jgi:uncharacterized protein YndB with AHSA1/START domain
MNTSTTDRIEKKALLRAPKARVWSAIADAAEFGTWFQVKIEGQFEPGARVRGAMTYPGHEGTPWDIVVDRMEFERLFSFRWHPDAVEPGLDYEAEPSTLVEFILEDAPGGTLLSIVESGFDSIPLERRAKAFSGNSEGWDMQLKALEAYVGA